MKYKLYLIIGLVFIVFLSTVSIMSYRLGVKNTLLKVEKLALEQEKKDIKSVIKIRDKHEKRAKINARIKIVTKRVVDHSGCLDSDLPDDYADGLREAYQSEP